MRAVLSLVLLSWVSNQVVGQSNPFTISQIDSISTSIDLNKTLELRTVEGSIKPKYKNKIKNLIKRHPQGTFDDLYYSEKPTGNLLKVVHAQSLFTEDLDSYYFINETLVLVVCTTWSGSGDDRKITSIGRYYFYNKGLIYRHEDNKHLYSPEALITIGDSYLMDNKSKITK